MTFDIKIAVIGLGYVGFPLARLFSTKYPVVGYDLNSNRVKELMGGYDSTLEVPGYLIKESIEKYGLVCTTDIDEIKDANFYIVSVPTPIDNHNKPDLSPLKSASETIGKILKRGDIVVYESTTYPGCTEEECVPVLETYSGLKFNKDFFVGYSPERINPGDKEHTVEKIKKVTSGSNEKTADIVDSVYRSVLINGTFKASSIKVAEASKIIENTQRDINIAFMNELSQVLNKMGIDTHEVLDAAATKWNFLKLSPGLVGGHCISVDPYYLIQKAEDSGVFPSVMFNARNINDSMGQYVADQVIKSMNKKGLVVTGSNILILGITFKENCPDIRNTKVVDVYNGLKEYTSNLIVYDCWANKEKVKREYGIDVVSELPNEKFDAVVLCVAHKEFLDLDIQSLIKDNGIIYDVKGVLPKEIIDARL